MKIENKFELEFPCYSEPIKEEKFKLIIVIII